MTESAGSARGTRDLRGLHPADVLLLLGYAAAALLWLWPLPHHPWANSVYDPGGFPAVATADFYLVVWILSWFAHVVTRAPLHLFDANTFHPAPLALAYSEHLIGYLPLFGPFWWATGNGILALNATAFLTYPLSAWFTYLFARRFVGRPGAAVAGAFCALRYELPPHFHLLGAQWFPVILYALDAWLDAARARHAVLLALALLLQCPSSVCLLYATMFLGVAAGPLLLLEHRARLDRRRIAGLALVLTVVGAVLVVSMLPYLTLRSYGLVPDYDDELVPLGLIPIYARLHLDQYLARGGVGLLGYVLALVAIVPGGALGWRRVRRLGAALVVVGVVAALGPRVAIDSTTALWSPYVLLMQVVPGFATVRQPARFIIVAQLGFALLAGLGVTRLVHGRGARVQHAVAAACVAAVLAARLWLPSHPAHPETAPGSVPEAYRWLAANGDGRAVVELPRARSDAAASRRAYASTYHWQPILEGYGAYPPQHRAYLYAFAERLPDEGALQDLVDRVDVGWVLLHRDELAPADAPRWAGALPVGLTLAAEWADAAVYRVERPVASDRRDRLLSTERTLDGTRIAPLGERCEGTLELAEWAEPLVAGSEVRVALRVENRSAAVWPAAGFYPRSLVGARGVVRRPDGRPISRWRTALPHDPRPSEPLAFAMPLRLPAQPGRYLLHVDLVQDGVMPLRDCGAPTLTLPLDVVAKPLPIADGAGENPAPPESSPAVADTGR
ncbi:MAG: hypothetical protein FJ148_14095 [Deltaproteobacteria bacterium]|nr:hypothetical protein [Deltaproteobacteria bacterium]